MLNIGAVYIHSAHTHTPEHGIILATWCDVDGRARQHSAMRLRQWRTAVHKTTTHTPRENHGTDEALWRGGGDRGGSVSVGVVWLLLPALRLWIASHNHINKPCECDIFVCVCVDVAGRAYMRQRYYTHTRHTRKQKPRKPRPITNGTSHNVWQALMDRIWYGER